VIGYFFNRTGGSVIPAIAIHGLVNFMGGITYFPSVDLGPWGDAWRTAFVCIWATYLIWRYGAGLGAR
jgi:membrane protease YdiL (CAAX protease family)